MMSLKEQLQNDMALAMRQGDTLRRDTLRMLLAAIKQEEIDRQIVLDDEGTLEVLSKQAKQRRESIADAEKANRVDLIAQEQSELDIINTYLPRMMTETEIRAIATEAIKQVDANGIKDMGKVMSQLMPMVKGRADGKLVSDVVRELLLDLTPTNQ
jgi:uncharacterized protein YqeY